MIHIVLPGKPLGKQRHQTTMLGKGENAVRHEFTPLQTVNYETFVKLLFVDKYPKHLPWERDIALSSTVRAFYSIPKSITKARRRSIEEGEAFPTTKPDIDNIEKVVWDALNQIAYADDSQIAHSQTFKLFSDRPRVELTLMPLSEYFSFLGI